MIGKLFISHLIRVDKTLKCWYHLNQDSNTQKEWKEMLWMCKDIKNKVD